MAAAEPLFLPSAEIDWTLLGRAVDFYKARGYTYVEAPWAVSEETLAITCPNPRFAARVDHLGALVGSAEQSFLHLDLAGDLGAGCFVACTPCFRLGDHGDGLHFPYFMKVELYRNDHDVMALFKMLGDAGELYRELGAPADALQAPQTEEGVDITLNGIEIGSFGFRTHESADGSLHHWTYGTGLALPRFSQALEVEGPNAAMKQAISLHRDLVRHVSVENGVSKLSPAGIAALLGEDA
jgi:hypothetical protein